MTDEAIRIDVKKCQRCGKNHDAMIFWPLLNPSDEFTYYGMCPAIGEPVLLKIVETSKRRITEMNVRAKFACSSVLVMQGAREVTFNAVYGKDGSDNAQWSKWTPNGSLKMTINNEAVFDAFEPGKEYYLDITPAEPIEEVKD